MADLPNTSNTSAPEVKGKYDVTISKAGAVPAGYHFRLARGSADGPLFASAPSQANRISTGQTSEDFRPDFGDVFSRNDFSGGEGLDNAYTPGLSDVDATRFWSSSDLLVQRSRAGRLSQLRLNVQGETLWSDTTSVPRALKLSNGNILYANGATAYYVEDVASTTPIRTSEVPHTGTPLVGAFAELKGEVFAACYDEGIGKRAGIESGDTWSDLASATRCENIWAVKGRLLADGDGVLQEIDPTTGAPTTLLNIGPNEEIRDVIDAGPVIVVATVRHFFSSTTSSTHIVARDLYLFTDDGGTLTLVSQQRINDSEAVVRMAYQSGVLLLWSWRNATTGFSKTLSLWRGRIGGVDAGYALTDLQLVWETTNATIQNRESVGVAVTERRAYWSYRENVSEIRTLYYDFANGGWFHYTSELGATGISDCPFGLLVFSSENVTYDNLWLFCTLDTVTRLLYSTTSSTHTPVTAGEIISPIADFFNPVDKPWADVIIEGEIGDGEVDVYFSTDPTVLEGTGSWTLVETIGGAGSGTMGAPISLAAFTGRYGVLRLVIKDGSTWDLSPIIYSFAVRAYTDSDEVLLTLPILVSDLTQRPYRQPIKINGWGERLFQQLRTYDGQHVTVDLYRPALTVEGIVQAIGLPATRFTRRGSLTAVSQVQVRGRVV